MVTSTLMREWHMHDPVNEKGKFSDAHGSRMLMGVSSDGEECRSGDAILHFKEEVPLTD